MGFLRALFGKRKPLPALPQWMVREAAYLIVQSGFEFTTFPLFWHPTRPYLTTRKTILIEGEAWVEDLHRDKIHLGNISAKNTVINVIPNSFSHHSLRCWGLLESPAPLELRPEFRVMEPPPGQRLRSPSVLAVYDGE